MITPIPSFSQGFATRQASAAPHLWKGIVAAYAPFLGKQGNTIFDWSGFKQDGAISGALWVPEGLWFDGSNDYFNAGADTSLEFTTGAVSFLLWVYFDDVAGSNDTMFIRNMNTGPYSGYLFEAPAGGTTLRFAIDAGANVQRADGLSLQDKVWYLLAITRPAGGEYNISINAREVTSYAATTSASPTSAPTNSLYIGGRGPLTTWGPRFTGGVIRNFMMYNRDLPVAELAEHYRNPYAMYEMLVSPVIFGLPLVAAGIVPFRRRIEEY